MVSLKDIAAEAFDPDFKAAVEDHVRVTETQSQRLDARIQALAAHKADAKRILNTLIARGSDLANIFHDKHDKQTQDAIKLVGLENFEVATYTALKAFSDSVGDLETAQLADQLIAEEQLAGERMLRLVPQLAKSYGAQAVV
jgi:ferritin-like metal-binding protein YciE